VSEKKRGCGYRKIGGLYLVSDPGYRLRCDGLPLDLEPCGCCGFVPPFSRNLQRLQPEYISQAERIKHERDNAGVGDCSCPDMCPLCNPEAWKAQDATYGLMFVGKQSYTPESFTKEAFSMGVSKRIPEIPSWLKLGETWILLAHQKVPKEETQFYSKRFPDLKFNRLRTKEPTEFKKAIFYGFKPDRVEMPVWKGDLSAAEMLKLEERGITPVFLEKSPQNLKRHKHAKNMEKNLKRFLKLTLKEHSEEEDE
jgi:hypothetical protein